MSVEMVWVCVLGGLVALNEWLLHERVRKLEKRARRQDVERMAAELAAVDAAEDAENVREWTTPAPYVSRSREVRVTDPLPYAALKAWGDGDRIHREPCAMARSEGKEPCDCWHSKVSYARTGAFGHCGDAEALKRMAARARDGDGDD